MDSLLAASRTLHLKDELPWQFFSALCYVVTLVGLPAAWIYYGPLPQGAQRVVDRFVEVARDAIGWRHPATVIRYEAK